MDALDYASVFTMPGLRLASQQCRQVKIWQIIESGIMRPKLGVLDFNPIQYHTPLYQGLARRGNVELDVLFLTDRGYRPSVDSSFGVTVSWDIDLLSGYSHGFLRTTERPSQSIRGLYNSIRILNSWIKSQEIIVIHGYANPWMLYAIVACRLSGTPYLLRGDSQRDSQASGLTTRPNPTAP